MSASRAIPSPATHESGDSIVRYNLSERVHHLLATVGYLYCLATGLAFWSPYLFWLAVIVGGGATARFWHPWFGLLFVIATVWMLRLWGSDMRITEADEAWKKAMPHYVRNEDARVPAAGRFNYGQKIFFWLMFWGAILLLLSGLGLWFVESIPFSLHWLRLLAVFVHVTAAFATIAGFMIHVYMGVIMVPGGTNAIVRGGVSRAWARVHHRLWYEQVTKGPTPPAGK